MIHRIPITTPITEHWRREPADITLHGFPRVGDVLPCPRWPALTGLHQQAAHPGPARWVWVLRR